MITRSQIRRQLRKGGITSIPRQGYFLGDIVGGIGDLLGSAADKAKEIIKSDVGKTALAAAALYATKGKWGPWLKGTPFAKGVPPGVGGRGTEGFLSKIGLTKGFGAGLTTAGKVAGALGIGALMMAPAGKDKFELDLLKERGGDVEGYLRRYYQSYHKAAGDWTQEDEDEFVATNMTEYSKGGRVGLYAGGPPEVMEDDLTIQQFMQDQGIDAAAPSIKREGVQTAGGVYNQGSDVQNALAVWNNMGPSDKSVWDGFPDFFRSGIWRDQIQGLRQMEKDQRTASAPDPTAEMNDFSMNTFGKPLHDLTPEEHQMLIDMANEQTAAPGERGIMAAKGGRIGYKLGDWVRRAKLALVNPYEEEEEFYNKGGRIGFSNGNIAPMPVLTDKDSIRKRLYDPSRGEDVSKTAASEDAPFHQQRVLLEDLDTSGGVSSIFGGPSELEEAEHKSRRVDKIRNISDFEWNLTKRLMEEHDLDYMTASKKAGLINFYANYNPLGLSHKEKILEKGYTGKDDIILKELDNIDNKQVFAKGGRIGKFGGGLGLPGIPRMAPDGLEYDMRAGGFQPLGAKEGKDDVKANLAKNEFVMTADAVRGAGGGDIELGAQKMYDTMKHLERKIA